MSMSLIDSTGLPIAIEKSTSQKVIELLATKNVHFDAKYVGQRKRENWDCDSWLVTFTNCDSVDKAEDFDFFTGLGCRAELTEGEKNRVKILSFPGLTANDLKNNNLYAKKYRAACEAARKPKTPQPADVLHSIILDSSSCNQSFEHWCSDLGYDSDSRKAFATYELCQKNGDKLNRVLGGKLIAELSELLQDL